MKERKKERSYHHTYRQVQKMYLINGVMPVTPWSGIFPVGGRKLVSYVDVCKIARRLLSFPPPVIHAWVRIFYDIQNPNIIVRDPKIQPIYHLTPYGTEGHARFPSPGLPTCRSRPLISLFLHRLFHPLS